jgi:hypothetical protein
MVYLTVAYAPYFSICASRKYDTERMAIVEFDTDRLNVKKLRPDEDYIEQGSRGQNIPVLKGLDMKARTEYIRNHIDNYAYLWPMSVDGLGTVCYKGSIPPNAITRISAYSADDNHDALHMALDPAIAIMNYKIMGDKYKALTRFFMGDEIKPEELLSFQIPQEHLDKDERWAELVANDKQQLADLIANRKVEVIYSNE